MNTEMIKLPSGINVTLSEEIYADSYLDFNDSQYFAFNNFI